MIDPSVFDGTLKDLIILPVGDADVVSEADHMVLHSKSVESQFIVSAFGKTHGHLYFEPVDIPRGGSLGFALLSDSSTYTSTTLARITHSVDISGRHNIIAEYKIPDIRTVDIWFQNDNKVLGTRSDVPIDEDGMIVIPMIERPPTSFHYIEIIENGQKVTILVLDYDTVQNYTTIDLDNSELPAPNTNHVVLKPEGIELSINPVHVVGYQIHLGGIREITLRENPHL